MIARLETLLPEPDSPTTPSVSPRDRVKLTSETAWTTPSAVGKRTVRPRTSSSVCRSRAGVWMSLGSVTPSSVTRSERGGR